MNKKIHPQLSRVAEDRLKQRLQKRKNQFKQRGEYLRGKGGERICI